MLVLILFKGEQIAALIYVAKNVVLKCVLDIIKITAF